MDEHYLDIVETATGDCLKCACVLLLDVSSSMNDPATKINDLNSGLEWLINDLHSDPLARNRVDLCIITFGGNKEVKVEKKFGTMDGYTHRTLVGTGTTPMGAALKKGYEVLEERLKFYKSNGMHVYKPWMFLLTDGQPTDSLGDMPDRIKQLEKMGMLSFFSVGVDKADMELLKTLSIRQPMKLKEGMFKSLFEWVSASLKSVSQSEPGEQIPLPPTTWGYV